MGNIRFPSLLGMEGRVRIICPTQGWREVPVELSKKRGAEGHSLLSDKTRVVRTGRRCRKKVGGGGFRKGCRVLLDNSEHG